MVLLCSSALYDKPGSFNPEMVLHGAFWYLVSVVGFLLTFSEKLDYYFFFDDIFMISTAFCLFYSWQSYDDISVRKYPLGLNEVPAMLLEYVQSFREQMRPENLTPMRKREGRLVEK